MAKLHLPTSEVAGLEMQFQTPIRAVSNPPKDRFKTPIGGSFKCFKGLFIGEGQPICVAAHDYFLINFTLVLDQSSKGKNVKFLKQALSNIAMLPTNPRYISQYPCIRVSERVIYPGVLIFFPSCIHIVVLFCCCFRFKINEYTNVKCLTAASVNHLTTITPTST